MKWRRDVEDVSVSALYGNHYKDGRYYNPWMPMENKGFLTLLRWKLSSKQTYSQYEKSYLPRLIPNAKKRIKEIGKRDFILWVGHATFLIRINGAYWLTDPVFSERALIPKRKTPPAISLEELAEISDTFNVVISHNHYDHLDKGSLKNLSKHSTIFVPKGLKNYVEKVGMRSVNEMDWWQSIDTGRDTQLVCLPAQHWSRRVTQGTNRTLWASYLLIAPSVKIYFGGDSGYFIGFKEFGQKFPDIDYALMPTTAYHPRWFMHYAHMNIAEALTAFDDLGAKYFIPTQWGAFQLGDEPPGYPAIDLQRTIKEKKLDPSKFIIMNIGQILIIP